MPEGVAELRTTEGVRLIVEPVLQLIEVRGGMFLNYILHFG
jgi:hypothetical protein